MNKVGIAILLSFVLFLNVAVLFGADAETGKVLYTKKCKVCHGVDGTPPAALMKANPGMMAFSSAKFQALKDPEIKVKITGSPKHKTLAKSLTEADIDNLIAFLRTLKK